MSPIHRPWIPGPVTIDARLLEEIEEAVTLDCAPHPSVVAPLMARVDAREPRWPAKPSDDPQLDEDISKAVDGTWLELEEIHYVQRLRGWHRTRYGRITVDACWLAAVRNLMDNLTLSLNDTCEEVIEELRYPGNEDVLATALASMEAGQGCGECSWCDALRLRDECDKALDDGGYDGGVYYRAYCLGESQAQLAAHYGWPDGYRKAS